MAFTKFAKKLQPEELSPPRRQQSPLPEQAPRQPRRATDKYTATTRVKKPPQAAISPDNVIILPASHPINAADGKTTTSWTTQDYPYGPPGGYTQPFWDESRPPDGQASISPNDYPLRYSLELGDTSHTPPQKDPWNNSHSSWKTPKPSVFSVPVDGGGRVSDSMRESSSPSRIPEDSPSTTTDKSRAPDSALVATERQAGAENPGVREGIIFTDCTARILYAMDSILSFETHFLVPRDRKKIRDACVACSKDIVRLQNEFAASAIKMLGSQSDAADTHRTPGHASTPTTQAEPPQVPTNDWIGQTECATALFELRKALCDFYSAEAVENRLAPLVDAHLDGLYQVRSEWAAFCSKLDALKRPEKGQKESQMLRDTTLKMEKTIEQLQRAYDTEVNDHNTTKVQLQEALETTTDQRLLDERARHTDTRERLAALRQKVEELHNTVVEKDEDLEDLKGEKAFKDEELQKAQDRIRVLEEENKKMREDHARKMTRLTDDSARELQRKMKEFDQRLKSKDEKLQKAIEEHLTETKVLKEVLLIVKGAVKDV